MVQLGASFDSSAVEPTTSFDPLPPDWYAMRIIASQRRDTKSGTGSYLWFELEIDESYHPALKGRRAWDRLNLWNPNQQAVEISQRTLSAICRACGVQTVSDSDQLHGITIAVKLSVREATSKFDAGNDVKGYDAVGNRIVGKGDTATPAAAGPVGFQPPPAQEGETKPPWQQAPQARVETAEAPSWVTRGYPGQAPQG